MKYPELESTVGKTVWCVMPPHGKKIKCEVDDEVREYQDEKKSKIILLQRIRFADGQTEIRVGYYIIGKMPRVKGRWVWGQFAAFIPAPVFRKLLRKARAKGWPLG